MSAGPVALAGGLDIADRIAIAELVARHAWLIDHGRAGEVAELFAEDGALHGVGPDKQGRVAIAQWAQQRAAMTERRSRHVQSNILIEPAEPGHAQGTVVLTLYRHDGPDHGPATPLLIGEYADRYRRDTDGAWHFTERRLEILFGNA